ncbi:dihydrolipoyllysine-residue acetyltransferase [Pelomonas sp. SE-A7]|uniref:dihydrolipoyllysine-residue acetyltransferase n=1 Tax=Pelomonas sp. SE-A7 TaxID=3054953 RepID=UPI00259D0505|nr:dihydrolipoyllysine-residue acetyltransferase [Pelomonas sp. SE-A7]MDM4766109.1 dihydrolipoyllysine-residue acetyltransferase [Pelomonas sp. SE-A7]
MALVEVKVPDIGDVSDVAVIELMVKVGDTVKLEQSLVTVESDKASMEIPSSAAGVVKEIKIALGDKVSEGSLLLVLEAEGVAAAGPAAPPPAAPPPAAPPPSAPPPAAPPPAAGASSVVEVVVPDIGDFDEVAVIEVMVKAGDTVKVEQSLITVESDKASMEIPSSHAGVIKELKVKLGDKVAKGSVLALVEVQGAAPAAAAPVAAPAPAPAAAAAAPVAAAAVAASPAAAVPAHDPTASKGALPHASPSIRKIARELGVPLAEVKGTGPKGRILETDVQGFVKSVMAGAVQTLAQKAAAPPAAAGGGISGLLPWPKVDFEKFGAIERKELSRIKKISGANLHRNWVVIPHVTNHDDADITELEAFRVQLNKENEKAGIKVTMLAFMIKAAVAALKKFPEFNSSLEGEGDAQKLVLKSYYNIGFAADTPNGLVVPVIKNADQKGIFQISQEMSDLAKKARDGKLGPADMSGGCFSISSLGGIGGKYFTPIINAPEVAIMGVCKSSIEPVWDGKAFQPRLILPLSLSWDHRVIDGAAAARFNVYFASLLADFRRIAL